MTNASDLQLVVLGSGAGAAGAGRGLGSLALLRSKDVWIVDAGEQMVWCVVWLCHGNGVWRAGMAVVWQPCGSICSFPVRACSRARWGL